MKINEVWTKYNAVSSGTEYYIVEREVGENNSSVLGLSASSSKMTLYENFSFNTETGNFYPSGNSKQFSYPSYSYDANYQYLMGNFTINTETYENDYFTMYKLLPTFKFEYTSNFMFSGPAYVGYNYIYYTRTTKTIYSKGTTSYGTISAETGTLPETGTLYSGSASDDYCIIEVDGTYYYYVKS